MEIAATGFASAFLPGFGRSGSAPDKNNQANNQPPVKPQTASNKAASGRIIIGEVLDKQTEIFTPSRQSPSFQQAASSFTQAENRQFSPQAAINMFQQNEATLTDSSQTRQVSGIIDIYV